MQMEDETDEEKTIPLDTRKLAPLAITVAEQFRDLTGLERAFVLSAAMIDVHGIYAVEFLKTTTDFLPEVNTYLHNWVKQAKEKANG